MAGTASLFRIESTGQTESTARTAGTIIEFNSTSGGSPDDSSKIDSLDIHYIEDISVHPNPNRHLSQIQDGKLGTIEFVIKGHIDNPDSAGLIGKFKTFMENDKTNTSLPFGKFGIRYDNMSQFDLTPTSTQGLILFDFQIKDVEEFQNKAEWIARLYRNGSV